MEVRNTLLGCPNLTIFWLYRDRSNVQSWNMAYSLLWIIILWAVICTEILGRELIYQLTSLLFKNRDKYVLPNCHCLAAQCHTLSHVPIQSSDNLLKHISTQTVQTSSPCLFFSDLSLYWSIFHFPKGSVSHENLAVHCCWSWIGPRRTDGDCMWLLQHLLDRHSLGWSGTLNVRIKLNSQIEH